MMDIDFNTDDRLSASANQLWGRIRENRPMRAALNAAGGVAVSAGAFAALRLSGMIPVADPIRISGRISGRAQVAHGGMGL